MIASSSDASGVARRAVGRACPDVLRYSQPVVVSLTRTALRSSWVPSDLDEVLEALVHEHGFEERSMMVSDGISVPDGLYVERIERGLLVWVPPDPSRTGGDPAILPAAVMVRGEPHDGGTRLRVSRVVAPATKLNLLSAAGLTLLAAAVASWIGGAVAWWVLAGLALVLWGELGLQLRVASARAGAAWGALRPALEELVRPEPEPGSLGPYRSAPRLRS